MSLTIISTDENEIGSQHMKGAQNMSATENERFWTEMFKKKKNFFLVIPSIREIL